MNIHVYFHPSPEESAKLDEILAILKAFRAEEKSFMSKLDDEIALLQTQATSTEGVEASAVLVLNKIPQLISDAVAKALADGATPAQLQALTDLAAGLQTSATPLAAAVAANP